MFFKKAKQIMGLKYRIKELEERICPNDSHDWNFMTSVIKVNKNPIDTDTVYIYKCKKCGKIKRTLFPI